MPNVVEEDHRGAFLALLLCLSLLPFHLFVELLKHGYEVLSRFVFVKSDLVVLGSQVSDALLHSTNLLIGVGNVTQASQRFIVACR